MPEKTGGVCYKEGVVYKENHQMCNVTNRKIIDQLKDRAPQITFTCNAEEETCDFQFWIGQVESFYCSLDTCDFKYQTDYDKNTTRYTCENIRCACVPGRMLCGEEGSIDIGDFLDQEIKGPASLTRIETETKDGTKFEEPAMNDLIKSVFGDEYITLKCHSGECVYQTDVPGYTRPVKEINTPLIAGVIAGCALFVVLVILGIWFLSRRSFRGGPIHLSDDSDEDMAQMMAEHRPASLQFEHVSYQLNGKQILTDVQGIALPGQLMAIMGASGAGKSTFLDILARKNKRGIVEGNFCVNGERVGDSEYRSVVGFVDQDDTLLPTLTVHETIMTSALLRLPRHMNISVKEQKVYEVEKQLGILPIKDQLIGSEEGKGRGISGGEKRRVGIACELVTSPSILFLDEPTSGLDAFNAFNVVDCLVTLAKNYNRTVIFTIHQPRSNIVALFDHLILLAKGRTVYSGPYTSCQTYFDNIGYACPPGFNIADYLVDLTMHADAAQTPTEDGGPASFDTGSVGMRTQNSSIRAIKSVASASNLSTDNMSYGSYNESIRRPHNRRKPSLKQRQDRQLFTRKKSSVGGETPSTPKTDDEASDTNITRRNSQDLIRMSKQQGHVPPQILDDPHQLPPPAYEINGLDFLISSYSSSDVAKTIREDIHSAMNGSSNANGSINGHFDHPVVSGSIKGYRRIGYFRQFLILSQRTWRNLYRNPMLMLTHYAIAILLAVLSGGLFYGLTDDIKGFQNRLGLFFFVLALFGFSTLTSLNVFSNERLLFLRERANGYYAPITYFAAKVAFDIVPLRLIPPIIMGAIVYPMSGLTPEWPAFFKFVLILVLFNLAAAAICLFLGIVFQDGAVANLIGSLVMLFSLLFAGLLLNHDAIPKSALWLQSLSIFHYGFEALIVNEVKYLTLVDHKYGLDIEVPGASILSAFGFNNSGLWPDVVGLAIFSAAFIVIAYLAMHLLLVEKR
ncbi:uncharacterized protein KY384_001981 [Bacidia gigantensis]|uniref:uncharacterized protein n=1 Tax=Bacidia gigantensis TaxID=2732470 RepID=UPI001D054FBB|nr:uncharacterized protein KY384_001981 [Bacidia gigantensis]KAG8533198.1 hypothetical protein KY384_001981 [Bacidia gigantensis]